MSIPHNLIVFFHDRKVMPDIFHQCVEESMAACTGFKLVFLDDAAVIDLLNEHFPHLSEWYVKIKVPAARADLGRLIGLYIHGGFYSDITMAWQMSPATLVDDNHDLMLVRRDDSPAFKGHPPEAAHVINGIIGATAQSQFILQCIKRSYFFLYHGFFNFSIGPMMGPGLVSETHSQMMEQIADRSIIRKYTELKEHYFRARRDNKINSQWKIQQRDGIVDRSYENGVEPIQQLWKINAPSEFNRRSPLQRIAQFLRKTS